MGVSLGNRYIAMPGELLSHLQVAARTLQHSRHKVVPEGVGGDRSDRFSTQSFAHTLVDDIPDRLP